MREITKISEEAQARLGTDRGKLALVVNSKYLPEVGTLPEPVQLFEVRWRGQSGVKGQKKDPDRPLPIFFRWTTGRDLEREMIRPSETLSQAFKRLHFALCDQNRVGAWKKEERAPDQLDITFREFFGDTRMHDWEVEISGPGPLEAEQEIRNRELDAEEEAVEPEEAVESEPAASEKEKRWTAHPEQGPPEPPELSKDPVEQARQLAEYGAKYVEWEIAYAPIRAAGMQVPIGVLVSSAGGLEVTQRRF
jgi:hypothetical protein